MPQPLLCLVCLQTVSQSPDPYYPYILPLVLSLCPLLALLAEQVCHVVELMHPVSLLVLLAVRVLHLTATRGGLHD